MLQPRSKALLDQLSGGTAGPDPGVITVPGLQPSAPVDAPPEAPPAPMAAPAAPKPTYGLEGFDAGKLASGHDSPKYQVGRVLQGFDPKAGLGQAGLMDALNKLGIGQFSSQSDKLSVANGDPRFKGMSTWDAIRDQEGDAGWQFGVDSDMPGQAGPTTGRPAGGYPLDPRLMGDPLAKIQDEIARLSGGNGSALLKQMNGAA